MKTILAFLLLASTCFAQGKIPDVILTIPVKVVGIQDGDTVTILLQGKQRRVRLEGIDAPESKQAFGSRAKEELSGMVFGKEVDFALTGIDRYGRLLGKLYVDGADVNLEMIRRGMAWHYSFYNAEPAYAAAHSAAKAASIGLWADKNPVEPFEFRKRK